MKRNEIDSCASRPGTQKYTRTVSQNATNALIIQIGQPSHPLDLIAFQISLEYFRLRQLLDATVRMQVQRRQRVSIGERVEFLRSFALHMECILCIFLRQLLHLLAVKE